MYKVYNRQTKKYDTLSEPNRWLAFLYDTVIGRVLLGLLTKRIFSSIVGMYMNSSVSKWRIKRFIEKNNINMSEYQAESYRSFNDFFIRKIKPERRLIDKKKDVLIAVSDARILRYKVTPKLTLNIKNSTYTVEELIKDKREAREYMGGECLVLRLDVDDYHRYVYLDEGQVVASRKINGVFHTVNPISDGKYKVYAQNTREWVKIKTENFGDIIQMEVGAMCVGRIRNFVHEKVSRGQEKGYFEFGGSTIIILFKKDAVCIDQDIVDNSFVGIETIVKQGEKIGVKA